MAIGSAPTRNAYSAQLDALRAIAALAVMAGHLRNIFFVDLPDVDAGFHGLVKAVYFATSLGHEAVMVFFVLSGFLVGGSVLRASPSRLWCVDYTINRLTRLWMVLIPALVLGLVWDRAGIAAFGTRGIYGGLAPNQVVRYAVRTRLSPAVLVGNALFLQGIVVQTFGSNSPLWSLSYEFWYYALFPLVTLGVAASNGTRWRLLSGATVIGICLTVGKTICIYFLIWLMGAIINLLPRPRHNPGHSLLVAPAGLLIAGLAVVKAHGAGYPLFSDFCVGLLTTWLVYAIATTGSRSVAAMWASLAAWLAGLSYTLYLVHLPVLAFASAPLANRRWQPDLKHTAFAGVIACCVLAYASLVARLTERKTGALRQRIRAELALDARPFGATV